MIIDEIKAKNIDSIKSKDTVARAILGIVMNKHMLLSVEKRAEGQEVSDAETVAILQKTIKELNDEIATYEKANRLDSLSEVTKQKELLESFMPKMMSEEEIKEVILSLDDQSIPFVMKHFKANYAGKCDMGVVQKVLKSLN